jgi:hypothetical protein
MKLPSAMRGASRLALAGTFLRKGPANEGRKRGPGETVPTRLGISFGISFSRTARRIGPGREVEGPYCPSASEEESVRSSLL